jgi:hypothetical protein
MSNLSSLHQDDSEISQKRQGEKKACKIMIEE